MATKKRRRKKKKKISAAAIAVIIGGLITIPLAVVAVLIIFRVTTIDDVLPNAFSYPTQYEEYVTKYSTEYNVEPAFIYAVIKTESNFKPKAESEVGARGLMQLMEEAFTWLKSRMGDTRNINFDSMFDPQTNIQYGTYYLSFLLVHYDNNMDLAAAAYHGGIGTVDGWLEQGIIDRNNVDVNAIPQTNDKTAEYIRRIRKSYSKYKEILKDKKDISN